MSTAVRAMHAVFGSSWRMVAMTSSPLIFGRPRSTSATSGRSRRASATPSSPVPAVPHTSKPWVVRTCAISFATASSSSTAIARMAIHTPGVREKAAWSCIGSSPAHQGSRRPSHEKGTRIGAPGGPADLLPPGAALALRVAAALALALPLLEPDVRGDRVVLADALQVEHDREEVQREGERAEELPEAHREHEQDRPREDDAHHHEPERHEGRDGGDEDEPADRQARDHGWPPFLAAPGCDASATGGFPAPPWANARGWIFSPEWQSTHFASPLRMSSS